MFCGESRGDKNSHEAEEQARAREGAICPRELGVRVFEVAGLAYESGSDDDAEKTFWILVSIILDALNLKVAGTKYSTEKGFLHASSR